MRRENKGGILDAVVVGIGNIGYLFSRDKKRKGTWSHAAAYTKSKKTRLIGVVDPDLKKRELFHEDFPNVPSYPNIADMLSGIKPDIVSICTPWATHYGVFKEVVDSGIKAIICEKPFCETTIQAEAIISQAASHDIIVAVNHQRRFNSSFLAAKKLISDGEIGAIKSIHALYPGEVYNIGTHLFDVIRMVVQRDPLTVSASSFPTDNENDPSISGWLLFDKGLCCTFNSAGNRRNLLVEVDIIGETGRVRVIDNGRSIQCHRFIPSSRFNGYNEPRIQKLTKNRASDPLLMMIDDLADAVRNKSHGVACSATDGFWALSIVEALCKSSSNRGMPTPIKMPRSSGNDANIFNKQ